MDQLKDILAQINKHRFWVLCVSITIATMLTWYLTSSGLVKNTNERRAKIDSDFQSAVKLKTAADHPNEFSNKGMDEKIKQLMDEVYAAWQLQYDHQVDVLDWPDQFGADFEQTVNKLKPIETTVLFPIENEQAEKISFLDRQRYRNFIEFDLPKLAEIIGATWSPAADAGKKTVSADLVQWSSSNQKNLTGSRFSWPEQVPSTLQVLYAQEDYWVLTALLGIIKETNGDVDARYQAAIKTVEFLEIGSDAIGVSGKVSEPGKKGSGGAGGGESGSMGSMGSMAGMGSAMPSGDAGSLDGGTTVEQEDPGDNRYVDLKYEPLTAAKLRSAVTSTDPNDAFLAVAKRMPVRMRFKMDQRRLNRLLSACGNSDLPLEVRQIRINTSSGSTFSGKGSAGGSLGGMGGGGGAPGMGGAEGGGEPMDAGSMGGGMSAGMGGGGGLGGGLGGGSLGLGGSGSSGGLLGGTGSTAAKGADMTPLDVDVEIYGIIYIYNPVDRKRLGRDSEGTPPVSAG